MVMFTREAEYICGRGEIDGVNFVTYRTYIPGKITGKKLIEIYKRFQSIQHGLLFAIIMVSSVTQRSPLDLK